MPPPSEIAESATLLSSFISQGGDIASLLIVAGFFWLNRRQEQILLRLTLLEAAMKVAHPEAAKILRSPPKNGGA